MNRFFLQGPVPRARPALRAALLVAGLAVAVGSLAAMSLRAAPGGDVIGAKRGQVRALEAEVLRIDAQANEAADAHAAAVQRARDLRARITETARGLAEARAARAIALRRLSERVVGLYAQDTPSLIEVLLASGGLTAAMDTQDAIEAIGEQDRAIVESIDATKARLTRLKADLEGDRAGVEASVAESADRLAELRGLIGDRRAALHDARGALDTLVANRAGAASDARAAAADAAAERALLRRATPAPSAGAAPDSGPAPATDAAPTPTAAPAGDVMSALARIAQCESGGNPQAVSASGQYRGKYQFDLGTWQSLGGSGDPAAASEAEQDRIAALLYARSGPAPWPVCGYR